MKTDENRILLAMGGGKDSLYTYRLLRDAGYDVECFYLTEPSRTWQQLRRVYQALDRTTVQHRVFLNANQLGRIERHVGRQYLLQFQIGQVVAACLPYALERRCQYIALGLERASDYPMIKYQGRKINHQHSKSAAFIRLLNSYLAHRLGLVQVISPLHGMYDLGIYARFIHTAPDLIKLQSSCGGANSYRRHCGRCEKCVFLAALFAGLSGNRQQYKRMFPIDPLNDEGAFSTWLVGNNDRPLACVGFLDEFKASLQLAAGRNWRARILELPHVRSRLHMRTEVLLKYLRTYQNRMVPQSMEKRLDTLLNLQTDDLSAIFKKGRSLCRSE